MDVIFSRLFLTVMMAFSSLAQYTYAAQDTTTESVETPEQIAQKKEEAALNEAFETLFAFSFRPKISDIKKVFGPLLYSEYLDFRELTRRSSKLTPFDNIDDFRQINIFNELINSGPRLIADFEKMYPGATFVGMGRDSAFVSDFLDAFYQELGQQNRVQLANVGRYSFKDPELLSDYFIQLGFNTHPDKNTPFFVPFDATNFQNNSQSFQLISALLERCRLTRGCHIDEVINHLGFINTGAQRRMYNRNVFNGDTQVLQNVLETNSVSHQFKTIVSAVISEDLTYTGEYHGSFGELKRVEGKAIATPGDLSSTKIRKQIILEQILLIRLMQTAYFKNRVFSIAREKLNYDFPMTRPEGFSQIMSIRGFVSLPGFSDNFEDYLEKTFAPFLDDARPSEENLFLKSLITKITADDKNLFKLRANSLITFLARRVAQRKLDPYSFLYTAKEIEKTRFIDDKLKLFDRSNLIQHLQTSLSPRDAAIVAERLANLPLGTEEHRELFHFAFTRLNKKPEDAESAIEFVAKYISGQLELNLRDEKHPTLPLPDLTSATQSIPFDTEPLVRYVRQIRPTLSNSAQIEFNNKLIKLVSSLDIAAQVTLLKQTYDGSNQVQLLQQIKTLLTSQIQPLNEDQHRKIAETLVASLQEFNYLVSTPETFENLFIEALDFLELGYLKPLHFSEWFGSSRSRNTEVIPLGLFQGSQKIKTHYTKLKVAPSKIESWFHADPQIYEIYVYSILKTLIPPENQNELAEMVVRAQNTLVQKGGTSSLEVLLKSLLSGIEKQFNDKTRVLVTESFVHHLLNQNHIFSTSSLNNQDKSWATSIEVLPTQLIYALSDLITEIEEPKIKQAYIKLYGRLGEHLPNDSSLVQNYLNAISRGLQNDVELWKDAYLEFRKSIEKDPTKNEFLLFRFLEHLNNDIDAAVNLIGPSEIITEYLVSNKNAVPNSVKSNVNFLIFEATNRGIAERSSLANLYISLRSYFPNDKAETKNYQWLFLIHYKDRIKNELKSPEDFLSFIETIEQNIKLSYHENAYLYAQIMQTNRNTLRHNLIQKNTEARFQNMYLQSGSLREAWDSEGISSPRVPGMCSVALANLGRLIGKKQGQ